MNNRLTLGIFGFGVVGQGLHDIIKTRPLNLSIKRFVIKHADKARSLPAEMFTTDARVVLDDSEINTIVELIDDAEAAYHIVRDALIAGKNVVSANKKMIASHLPEFIELQQRHGSSLLYEGAVCGSIPIIRNLEEYYDNELLHSVSGIFNGSSNYILSKIFDQNLPYDEALRQAQALGFAETDPTLDVGGFDARFKLAIVASHAYGIHLDPQTILTLGITTLGAADIRFAREKGYKIKLIPTAREINDSTVILYVLPKFIGPEHILYNVDNEYNGVSVKAAFADEQFFYGKGAGGHPTGSAVLSDIAALRYGYRYEYKKHLEGQKLHCSQDLEIKVYLRYEDEDLPGQLGFTTIAERYVAAQHKYVIGTINLRHLYQHQDSLRRPGVFLAEIP